MREILAYEGPSFTIEWYYDENGISQALDYFNRLGDTFFFMGKKIMKKAKSTFERIMSDPKQKKAFEKEYANFLLSELILDAMAEQDVSVRALSKASGISTSVIQNLRAMQPMNITLKTLNALLSSLGYELVARKGRHCVNLSTL